MIDYFAIYKCILESIQEENISDAFQLFDFLSEKQEIKEMRNRLSDKLMIDATLETLDNLVDDHLVIAKRYTTSEGTLYQIERLSTAGHTYLIGLKSPTFKEKAINFLKSEGIPLSPQSVSKAIVNLIL
ncbi:hypothetical protein MXZ81_06050 [Streptococcus uberis]|nr:hypothetical protein [Streptococcus uberis]